MHEEIEEGDRSLHDMQLRINLLDVAGLWIMHGVQEKSYAALRAAELHWRLRRFPKPTGRAIREQVCATCSYLSNHIWIPLTDCGGSVPQFML